MSQAETETNNLRLEPGQTYKHHNILSNTLAHISRFRSTEELTQKVDGTTSEQRAKLGLEIYQTLAAEHKDKQGQFEWGASFFKTWLNSGAWGIRNFLEQQNVFSKHHWLTCPPDVVPGMEITNLDPDLHKGKSKNNIDKAIQYFFAEYDHMQKHVLDIMGTSLLLKNTSNVVLHELGKNIERPLIAVGGAGSGRELTPFLKKGLSILVMDHTKADVIKNNLGKTANGANIEIISNGKEFDNQPFDLWKKTNYQPTIFVSGKTDLTIPGATDKLVPTKPSLVYTQYVFHEIPDDKKQAFTINLGGLCEGPVVCVDCLPSKEALNVVLGVFERLETGLPLDAYGAVVTHLVGKTPEEIKYTAQTACPERKWETKIFHEPPNPLLSDLQQVIIGRKK